MSIVNHMSLCKGGDPDLTIPKNHISKDLSVALVSSSIGAFSGWAVARTFMNLNPMIGLIFGAASNLTAHIIRSTHLTRFFGNSPPERIARFLTVCLATIAGGYIGVMLMGYHIAFGASLILSLLMIPIQIITGLALEVLSYCC